MYSTVTQFLSGISAERDRNAVFQTASPLADRYNSVATSTAGLVITATSGTKVPKIGSVAFQGIAAGVPVTIAASTDMPALVGSITAAYYNVYCFFIDSASVVTSAMGTEGASLAAVKFPQFPTGKALVGYIIVTYASAFVGGTTSLGTATTVYVSPVGAFDPNVLI
jgi:hypothetical protein